MNKKQPQDVAPQVLANETPRKRITTKLIVRLVLAIVVFGIVVGGALYVMWLNGAQKLLLDSLHNTLSLQQTTYQVAYDNPGKNVTGLQKLMVGGRYNKSGGYALNATVTSVGSGYNVAMNADVVLDTHGNSYYNYKKITESAVDSTAAQLDASALQTLQNTYSAHWVKVNADSTQQAQVCLLVALQNMQANPAPAQALGNAVAQSNSLAISTVSSVGNTGVYDITGKVDKADRLEAAYTQSDFYKDLIKCNPTQYKLTSSALKKLLQQVTVRVTVDKKARLIEKVAVTYKQGSTITINLSIKPAQKTIVAIPKDSINSLPAMSAPTQEGK